MTISSLLAARAAAILGRDEERAALGELLGGDRPIVVAVHGLAGVGKSALLAAFAADARRLGAHVVPLDCRTVEPTESGFLTALASVTGRAVASVTDAAEVLGGLGERVVLTLDTYEVFRLLDTWLRHDLIPSLPANVRVVLAGREPPVTGWLVAFGDLLRVLPLRSIAPEHAHQLLIREGVPPGEAARVNRLARGHPLALRLAATARAGRSALTVPDAALMAVVAEFAAQHLAGLDAETRTVVDAAGVVRRPTLSLLGAMLPDRPPQDAFDRLRTLPFVELDTDGLVLHDTMREVVASLLRTNDPGRHRAHRVAAWRQLRRELRTAGPRDLWRYTADLLYLIENPAVREAFFPTGDHRFTIEPAGPDDVPFIEAVVERHESSAARELLHAWWQALPGSFQVARDVDGSIAAVRCLCRDGELPSELLRRDPVAVAWRTDLRERPVPRGQRVLFERWLLDRETGRYPAPSTAALVLDLKRAYLELRPVLRRIYAPLLDTSVLPTYAPLGFTLCEGVDAQVGGRTHRLMVNDFGPASVDGWLSDLAAREMLVDDDLLLDPARRQLLADGERVDLTRLEFDVLHYLYERDGRNVDRASLLRDVWGYDWSGGSNVVEVVVSALRRKLGPHAGCLQTVRGVGYRFTAPR
jgi:hypothetical protein